MATKNDSSTLNALGNLIKLLPTGTVFLFQFLSPVLSNNGHCHRANKYFMGALLAICGLNCAFSTFTDSHKDEEGNTHYGVVTLKGLWRLSPSVKDGSQRQIDLTEYRVHIGDFVHAVMGLLVFGVVAVLDSNTMDCFAPGWEDSYRQTILTVLPPIVGAVCSVGFALFPSKRNGIGYPSLAKPEKTIPTEVKMNQLNNL